MKSRLYRHLLFWLIYSVQETLLEYAWMPLLPAFTKPHGNGFEVYIQKEIDDYNQLIAPLILLPFIKNAFKHGINETIDDTSIEVRVGLKEGQLTFFVKNSHDHDDGKPINENIGLSSVRRQLELMYKEYSLNTFNLAQTFTFDLKTNLNRNGNV